MKVITISNQKGGIGKTTTATNMAGVLAKRGCKTLLIDADVQRNSSDTFRAETENCITLYDVILEKEDARVSLDDAVQTTEIGCIIASDPRLADAETILQNDPVNGLFRLREAVEKSSAGYDYIIIDTNPSLGHMLLNALIASDEVIIPISADRYGLVGLADLSRTIGMVKSRPNENLKVAGLLLVKYRGQTTLAKEIRQTLYGVAEQLDTRLFDTVIRDTIKVGESQTARQLLKDYAPRCTSAMDYEAFVDEYLAKGE